MKKINKVIAIILIVVSVFVFKNTLSNKINDKAVYTNQANSKEGLEKVPMTNKKIKNVIYMIGDGMGENHIIAGEIYKGEQLNIQKIKDKAYVITESTEKITDSAAAATALATGYKTNNGMIGKDKYGNDVENLIEYANKRGLKTGIVCTQILNHATPAGFSVHNYNRNNYEEIAKAQIESCVDLMFGGGRRYFSKYKINMEENGFRWVNTISELSSIDKNSKVIGTFASDLITKEENRVSLAELSKEAIYRLENNNGFFLMIEGSNIDTYSHEADMSKMLQEMIEFDEAVKIAKDYVDSSEDTILIVTADHETGGLDLTGIKSANQLTDSLFLTGNHTSSNVLIYAYGNGAEDLTRNDMIDNTDICKFIRKGIENYNKK